MIPGFHCSGLEFHDPATLIPRLAEIGFGAVAIRPLRGGFDPESATSDAASLAIAAIARDHQMEIVIDRDSPFYDDPDSIEPFSLASADDGVRDRAIASVIRLIERTACLQPRTITLSTGRVESLPRRDSGLSVITNEHCELHLERLASAIESLLQCAASAGVDLALRPVSEHLIATAANFERFEQWIGSETPLGLAADVGEMLLGGEFPIGARLARLRHRLSCVYLCEPDLERGHDQRLGHGDIDLGRVWEVLTASGFSGPAIFRAIGHGRLGLDSARQAFALLGEVDGA